jgi:uncharacterized protein YkwD
VTARKIIATLIFVIGGLVLTACQPPMDSQQSLLFNMINQSRNAHWMGSLADDYTARQKAENWADNMAYRGYIYHSNLPSGMESVNWTTIGENVGRGYDLAPIHQAFMESPTHKANILGNYTHVGVGVSYNGSQDLYYVSYVFYR